MCNDTGKLSCHAQVTQTELTPVNVAGLVTTVYRSYTMYIIHVTETQDIHIAIAQFKLRMEQIEAIQLP